MSLGDVPAHLRRIAKGARHADSAKTLLDNVPPVHVMDPTKVNRSFAFEGKQGA